MILLWRRASARNVNNSFYHLCSSPALFLCWYVSLLIFIESTAIPWLVVPVWRIPHIQPSIQTNDRISPHREHLIKFINCKNPFFSGTVYKIHIYCTEFNALWCGIICPARINTQLMHVIRVMKCRMPFMRRTGVEFNIISITSDNIFSDTRRRIILKFTPVKNVKHWDRVFLIL